MRPVELVMQGFGPFRDRVTVDFADADLIAIVGATGHGKSSIIDAICFALYGRVPRHGDKDIAPVITLGAAEAQVKLTFTLGDRRYLASRVVRRNADGVGAKTRALRLEEVHDDGTTEMLAGAVREFDPRVRAPSRPRLRSVHEVCRAAAGPVCRVLAGEQWRARARSSARCSASVATSAWPRPPAIGPAAPRACARRSSRSGAAGPLDEEALDAHRRRRDALGGLVVDIEAARAVDERLAVEIEECRHAGDTARSTIAALVQVRVDQKIAPLAAITEATEARAVVVAAADAAEARATAAANALDELPPLEELTSALEAHVERATIADRIATGTEIHAGLVIRTSEARDVYVAAQQAATDAQTVVDETNRQHAHAELRASLVKGEPCPVCEQTVDVLPPKLSTAAATRARKALETARRASSTAETNANAILTELHKAEAQLESLRERQDDLDAKIAARPDRAALESHDRRREGTARGGPDRAGRRWPGTGRPSPPRTVASRPRRRSSKRANTPTSVSAMRLSPSG